MAADLILRGATVHTVDAARPTAAAVAIAAGRIAAVGDAREVDALRGPATRVVVPDRPAVLTNRDIHGAWVNSRALEAAGITAATLDPPGGRIERDAYGAPMGTLQEQAMALVLDRAPAPTHADRVAGIRAGVEH